ncbi:MAG: hypothetical protein WKG03_06940, partial [Telluria sp.]
MSHPNPSEIEAVHGAFFGSTIDPTHCEILAIQLIDRKILALEAGLYAYKWFDYRELHPTAYSTQTGHLFRRKLDSH